MKKLLFLVLLLVFSMNLTPNNNLNYGVGRNKSLVIEYYEEVQHDKEVYLILKTIRTIESGNNYECGGLSREYGAYQFTNATWKQYSIAYFNTVLDITIPENQDKVAEMKIRHLLNSGFELDQIASFWNSGRKEYHNNIGVNRFGVNYNVPQYVNTFMKTYQKYYDCEIKKNSVLFCNLNIEIPYKGV